MRLLPKTDYKRLKGACRDLVDEVGSAKRATELTRICAARLSEALAPHCEDRFLCIDQVADLEADVGSPIVTRILADMLGYDVVARETKPSGSTLRTLIAAVNKESAEVTTSFLAAPDERAELKREAEEAVEALRNLIIALTIEPTLRAVG